MFLLTLRILFPLENVRLGFWHRGVVCNVTELRSSHAKHQHLISIIFDSNIALGYIYHSYCSITQQEEQSLTIASRENLHTVGAETVLAVV